MVAVRAGFPAAWPTLTAARSDLRVVLLALVMLRAGFPAARLALAAVWVDPVPARVVPDVVRVDLAAVFEDLALLPACLEVALDILRLDFTALGLPPLPLLLRCWAIITPASSI